MLTVKYISVSGNGLERECLATVSMSEKEKKLLKISSPTTFGREEETVRHGKDHVRKGRAPEQVVGQGTGMTSGLYKVAGSSSLQWQAEKRPNKGEGKGDAVAAPARPFVSDSETTMAKVQWTEGLVLDAARTWS